MRKRGYISNSAQCEGCSDCTVYKASNGIEMVECKWRNRKWIFGQYIPPCEKYTKVDEKNKKNVKEETKNVDS